MYYNWRSLHRFFVNPVLAQEFDEKLAELEAKGACRIVIQVLTTIAGENIEYASDIVSVIERRVKEVCNFSYIFQSNID
jgi:CO dehydrogenase/acetyl-CoA synthase beta subunit